MTVRYKPPTRKTDAWGTPFLNDPGELQQWYSLIVRRRQEERTKVNLGQPPKGWATRPNLSKLLLLLLLGR